MSYDYASAQPSAGNRRQSRRVPISIAVKSRVGEEVLLCQAGDISADGIFLASVVESPPAAKCLLEFSLPGSSTVISARGRVVRQIQNGRYQLTAVRFATIAPSHRRLIARYVANPEYPAAPPAFHQLHS
jgi:c-di-GMP-binding flagellar brake protein YcgR